MDLDLGKYEPLIQKLGNGCYRRLPRSSTYDREDLYQEGRAKTFLVADKYDPTRGTQFITLLTVSLINRYEKIVYHEWRRHWALRSAGWQMPRAQAPDQRAAEVLMGMKLVQLPDRYGSLQKPQYYLIHGRGRGQLRLLVSEETLDSLVAEISASR